MIGQMSLTLLVGKFYTRQNLSTDTFFLFYVDSVVRNYLKARKKHTLAPYKKQYNWDQNYKRHKLLHYTEIVQLIPILKNQLLRAGNSRTDTRVVVFLVRR